MYNFQGFSFIWIQIYSEIFKTALVYVKDMEFRVNSTSWRITGLSEFLLNKLIPKICQLVNAL